MTITYQKNVSLQGRSFEGYFGFHDEHAIVHHRLNICAHPSHASHRFHFVDDDRSSLDAVFTKQREIVVKVYLVVVCKI